MEIVIFVIPFITALFLLWKFRKETVWWEYILLIVPSLLIGLLFEFIFKSANCADTEYLSSYITKIRYEEPWNEYIHRTCYRHVKCGKSTISIPYDCSYVDEHPARWKYYDNFGNETYFYNENEFNKVKARFNTKAQFVELNRNYYTKDGDAYEYNWNGSIDNAYTLTETESYQNPIKASRSIFKFEEISQEEAKKLGLFEYHDIIDYDQNPIYGIKLPFSQEQQIRWLNGYYGPKKQCRIQILVYKNKPESIADKQRSYWEGGNKNEVICCIGVNSKNKVVWSRAFSWEDEPNIAIKSQNWFLSHSLDMKGYSRYISPLIEKQWHRKQFKDFNYLTIEIIDTEYIVILILVLIYNIGMSYWLIVNEYTNGPEENKKRKYKILNGYYGYRY